MSEELISQNVISIFKSEKTLSSLDDKQFSFKEDSLIIVFLGNGHILEVTVTKKDFTLDSFYNEMSLRSVQNISFWMTDAEYHAKHMYIFYDMTKQKWIYDTNKNIHIKSFSEFFNIVPPTE